MKAKIPLFLLLLGSLFIFIGVQTRGPVSLSPAGVSSSLSSNRTNSAPSGTLPLTTPQDSNQEALVTRVVDGDTIDVQINGQKDVVRLIGINAPETNQCFGKEATEKAASILSSGSIILEADPTQGDRDKYRRLLRYVFINNLNFDEQMIKEGFAKEYTYDKPYKYQSEFKKAQIDAQANKKGLWADNACSNFVSPSSSLKPSSKTQSTPPSQNGSVSYNCDCSKLCSQISTCQEAYYQLNQCGCLARDSDHDGIPCESLCK